MVEMKKRQLGRTGVMVSELCLGTMTFGRQTDQATAHRIMDCAVANGINFFDAAEMYPTPVEQKTYGNTEEIIGTWLKARGKRDDIVLATKMVGRSRPGSPMVNYIRPELQVNGEVRINRSNIVAAIDASLMRLKTDYVDLYQLHWPDRKIKIFGRTVFVDPGQDEETPIIEQLETLDELVKAGKVRHVGLSNESGWGAMTFLHIAEKYGLPRVVSIQNSYSLIDRLIETDVAEVAHREACGVLAYSPLRCGLLTGKYLNGKFPKHARFTEFYEYFKRIITARGVAATERYVALAKMYELDPAVMAIAFARTRPFVTSVIIGVRTLGQLEIDLQSASLELPEEVLGGISAIHDEIPNPCV